MYESDLTKDEQINFECSFENEDGSGKLFILKDPKSGKYYASKFGDVVIRDDNEPGEGVVYFMGDVRTKVSIDGNVELFGDVSANITASGYIHKNDRVDVYKDAKLCQYSSRKNKPYDISIKNGRLEFEGDLLEHSDTDGGLLTHGRVNIKRYADVVLYNNLSITTRNRDYAMLYAGNSFTVSDNINLTIYNSNFDDDIKNSCGLICMCNGNDKVFKTGKNTKVDIYGKSVGVKNSEFCNINVGGSFIVHSDDCAFENNGCLCALSNGDIDIVGVNIGFTNTGENSKLDLKSGSRMSAYGKFAGASQSIVKRKFNGKSFLIEDGATMKVFNLLYKVSGDKYYEITDFHNSVKSIESFITIAGTLYAYNVRYVDPNNAPIDVKHETAKVYFNDRPKSFPPIEKILKF